MHKISLMNHSHNCFESEFFQHSKDTDHYEICGILEIFGEWNIKIDKKLIFSAMIKICSFLIKIYSIFALHHSHISSIISKP